MTTPFGKTRVTHLHKSGRRRSQSFTFYRSSSPGKETNQNIPERRDFLVQLQAQRNREKITSPVNDTDPMSDGESEILEGDLAFSKSKSARTLRPTASKALDNQAAMSKANAVSTTKKEMGPRSHPDLKHDALAQKHSTMLGASQLSLNHSQISKNPLLPRIGQMDHDLHLTSSTTHLSFPDEKNFGTVKIGSSENSKDFIETTRPKTSSVSCIAAIAGITIACIAFVLALTAFILVLIQQSNSSSSNSASSSSSSSASSSITISGSTLFDACSNYTSINDPTRNINAPGYALGCDNTAPFINRTHRVWIRFEGSGGTTLPLATPGMNLCGSEGTGWFDGTMPTSYAMMVNGTVCFTWYNTICRFSQSISVVHCGSFYSYLLPTAPACMMRYCTI